MTPRAPLITVAGVDVTTLCHSIAYQDQLNGPGRASFVLDDPAGVIVPAEDDAVGIALDGADEWSGEVAAVDVSFLGELEGTSCRVTATNKARYPQRAMENAPYASRTLKSILQEVLSAGHDMNLLGITLDAAQVDGPTLVDFAAVWWTVEALLNYLSAQTGYPWRITAAGVLKMFAIGSEASGITISAANGNLLGANWTRHRFDYRNKQYLIYGPTTEHSVTDSFAGDGVTRVFPLNYTPISLPNIVHIEPDGIDIPVAIDSVFPPGVYEWTYRALDNSLVQDASFPELAGGQTMTATYTTGGNITLVTDAAEIAARGIWSKIESKPEILTVEEAEAYAQALIDANKGTPQRPSIETTEYTILPGQTLTVDVPQIGLSSVSCLVVSREVRLLDSEGQVIPIATLSVLGGNSLRPTTFDLWRRILTGGASGGGSAVASGGGGGGGIVTGGKRYADLGGSKNFALELDNWQPVPEGRDVILYSTDFPGSLATVHVYLATRNAATSVEARLVAWDGAAWQQVGITAAASTETDINSADAHQTFVATVTNGARHRLEIRRSNPSYGVYGLGYVE